MDFIITNFDSYHNWVSGTIGEYKFNAKQFNKESEFGIDNGKISKLEIYREDEVSNRNLIASYDRGWDIKPKTEEQEDVLNEIMEQLKSIPKRLENELTL